MVGSESVIQHGQPDSGDGSIDKAIVDGVMKAKAFIWVGVVVIPTLCAFLLVCAFLGMENFRNPGTMPDLIGFFDPKRMYNRFFANIDSFSFLGVMATVGLAATVASFDRARNALRLSDQFTSTPKEQHDTRKRFVTHLHVLKKAVLVEVLVAAGMVFFLLFFAYSVSLGKGDWIAALIALLIVLLLGAGSMTSGIISLDTVSISLPKDQRKLRKRKRRAEKASMRGVGVYWVLVGLLFVVGVAVLSLPGNTLRGGIEQALMWISIVCGWCIILFSLAVLFGRNSPDDMFGGAAFALIRIFLGLLLVMVVLGMSAAALGSVYSADSGFAVVLALIFTGAITVLFVLRVLGDNGYTCCRGFMKVRLSSVPYLRTRPVVNSGKELVQWSAYPRRTVFKGLFVVVVSILWILPVAWKRFEALPDKTDILAFIICIGVIFVFAYGMVFGGFSSIILYSRDRLQRPLLCMVPVFIFAFTLAEFFGFGDSVPFWAHIVALLSVLCVAWMTWANVQPSKCPGATFWLAPRIVWTEIHNSSAKKTKERMEESIRKSDKVYGTENQKRTA